MQLIVQAVVRDISIKVFLEIYKNTYDLTAVEYSKNVICKFYECFSSKFVSLELKL